MFNLKKARKVLKLSTAQLSNMMGNLDVARINRYENGKTKIDSLRIKRIKECLLNEAIRMEAEIKILIDELNEELGMEE